MCESVKSSYELAQNARDVGGSKSTFIGWMCDLHSIADII